MITTRTFCHHDAPAISALFHAVYGDNYVYPDIYLPGMIRFHNDSGDWRSVLAIYNNRVVGHAALWRHAADHSRAEFAMCVVDPHHRGKGIATQLGQHILHIARETSLSLLTMKMVTSKTYSQQLAMRLGFTSTGLLMDYVTSPFQPGERESIVAGVLPLKPNPLPQQLLRDCSNRWVWLLLKKLGSSPFTRFTYPLPAMQVNSFFKCTEITLNQITAENSQEICRLSRQRLIHVRIQLSTALFAWLPRFHRAGYVDAGLLPAPQGKWYWLLLRGHRQPNSSLVCPIARELQTHILAGATVVKVPDTYATELVSP